MSTQRRNQKRQPTGRKPTGRKPSARKPIGRKPPPAAQQPGERLQKILASAGLGSRRQCEELIAAGRVEVDRQVVTEMGTRVDPAEQQIRVDGVALTAGKRQYFAVNKPVGIVCTNRDPSGRPRVVDLVPIRDARLFTIGRLDMSSDGLILVTNDGDLANRLTHPRYGVAKTYRVTVAGRPDREIIEKLRKGIHLAEGVARAERIDVKSRRKESTILEMVLREGKNREIRRIFARIGHKVLRLTRVAVGPVRLGDLPPGETRRLTREEIRLLQREGAVAGKQ